MIEKIWNNRLKINSDKCNIHLRICVSIQYSLFPFAFRISEGWYLSKKGQVLLVFLTSQQVHICCSAVSTIDSTRKWQQSLLSFHFVRWKWKQSQRQRRKNNFRSEKYYLRIIVQFSKTCKMQKIVDCLVDCRALTRSEDKGSFQFFVKFFSQVRKYLKQNPDDR